MNEQEKKVDGWENRFDKIKYGLAGQVLTVNLVKRIKSFIHTEIELAEKRARIDVIEKAKSHFVNYSDKDKIEQALAEIEKEQEVER